MILDTYSLVELAWIALCIMLIGMSKGGFPVGSIALPALILIWPGQVEPAKTVVAFMLPVLCVMDVVALAFYRGHILWRRLVPMLPGTLLGVAVGSMLFVSKEAAMLTVSDRWLKLCIGVLGIGFVLYYATRKWILRRLDAGATPGRAKTGTLGFLAGFTSTLAHAAGPVLQMYLLPQRLAKLHFAGTTVAFFFLLNLVIHKRKAPNLPRRIHAPHHPDRGRNRVLFGSPLEEPPLRRLYLRHAVEHFGPADCESNHDARSRIDATIRNVADDILSEVEQGLTDE